MISSEPAEVVLDHDHLEDVDGAIYVAIGNRHLPNAVIAYLKYVPTARRTPWCRGSTCFERVVRRYGATYVLSAVRDLQEEVYDPALGVTVPVVRFSRVRAIYRPRERLAEILRRPRGLPLYRLSSYPRAYWRSVGLGLSLLGLRPS